MTAVDPCGPGCTLCAADLEARERYLAKHRKYNGSSKGQKRNQRYEDTHPERKLRWEPARNALRSAMPPGPETPMHNGADLPPEPWQEPPVTEAGERARSMDLAERVQAR